MDTISSSLISFHKVQRHVAPNVEWAPFDFLTEVLSDT
jgi:hypothetical protein